MAKFWKYFGVELVEFANRFYVDYEREKEREKGKKSMTKPTLPVLQVIMSGDTRQAVLVEYQGKQYILYVGESLGHIRLESIGEDKAVWQTPTGEQVMHMHQIGK